MSALSSAEERLPPPEEDGPRPNLVAQETRRELFDVLVAEEVSEDDEVNASAAAATNPREASSPAVVASPKGLFRPPLKYVAGSVQASAPSIPSPPVTDSSQPPKSFLERMMESAQPPTANMKKNHRLAQDPYQDFTEGRRLVLSPNISANDLPESLRRVKIPTLRECQNVFYCEEADEWLHNARNPFQKLGRTLLKYYRTPQATRSFGRVYIFVLPWLTGPYFAWVFEEQLARSYAFTLVLAGFTFLVLQGLLNTQQGLEDPFLIDFTSFTPGIDALKLDYEMAVGLQAVEQYYAAHRSVRLGIKWNRREKTQRIKSKSEFNHNSYV